MVLSACSTYFEQLFLEHAEPPVTGPMIVIMRETSFDDLAIIVEFMYKGEINVSQDQLGSLLRTAESLRVKGLAQASSGGHGDSIEQPSFTAAAPPHQPPQQQPVSLTREAAPCRKTPTPTTTPPHSQSSTFSPPPHTMGQAPPPPALLPLFQNAALLSAAITTVVESSSSSTGRESPSSKRRRIRPKIEPGTASHQDHSNYSDNSRPSSATFTPRIENVVTMGPPPRNEATAETPTRSETMESAPTSALDLRLTDPSHLQELTARLELRGNFAIQPPDGDSETLRKVQQEKSEPHCFFRGYAVYKFNDYIAHGTRQQYWEEPFTKAVMEGIQDRELDLKKELNCWACRTALFTEDTANATAICATPGRGITAVRRDAQRRGENGGMTAEELVVEVDSYMDEDVIVERMSSEKSPADIDAANKQESLILSIRHGKVQRKLQGAHHKESS
ncbi:Bric-A-brac 2-like protein [Daphnia magna]|uniref:Bric-A-brac 2-like protein n=1 Tax=Daphnia magna TaxID=35525 RepID=A0A164XGH9_9CRUS|nr:Bric-A-brac 2-like protein [Daphnia magna]